MLVIHGGLFRDTEISVKSLSNIRVRVAVLYHVLCVCGVVWLLMLPSALFDSVGAPFRW